MKPHAEHNLVLHSADCIQVLDLLFMYHYAVKTTVVPSFSSGINTDTRLYLCLCDPDIPAGPCGGL